MRNVEWNSRQGPVCHPVYERKEADDIGIEYLENARLTRSDGVWVLTDDEKVVKVLKYGVAPNGQRWIRTCTGTFSIDIPSVVVDTVDRASRFSMTGTKRTTSHKKRTPQWDAFASLVAMGTPLEDAYRQVYPEATSPRYIREKASLLASKKEVRDILARKVGDIMAELGITPEFILTRYKDLAEDADNDSVSLASLNSLAKIAGMMDQKEAAKSVNAFLGLPQHMIDAIKQSVTVPVKAIVESDGGFGEAEVVEEEDPTLG